MNIVRIILYVLLALDSIALIAIVLMQEGQSGGLGAMVGMSDGSGGFSSRSRGAKLKVYTQISAAALFVFCVALTIVESLI